ncbi:MFS transporter [Ferrimicrobium acidiphilum]|uniref:MFS transporter n=1 Tax=Ferrimicrobium acidiphilum TaxID=121039 RepID=UPI0023F2D4D3|nr:MFS transporter [Ferrimicrobium acidiphilum]
MRFDRRDRGAVTLALSIAATTITTLPVFLTGALAVVIRRHLGLSSSELGLLVAGFFAAAVPSSLFIAPRVAGIGAERIMRLSGVAATLALVAIASVGGSFTVILVALIVGGVANGAMQPAVNLYLTSRVHLARQGFAFGVKQAAIPVSTLLAGMSVPLVALAFGWRYAYVGAAGIALVVTLLLPKYQQVDATAGPRSVKTTVVLKPLIFLAVGIGLGAGAANGLGAFFISSTVHIGVAAGTAGYMASIGSLASLITRVASGYFADRRSGNHFVVVAIMLSLGALGYILLSFGFRPLIVVAAVLAYAAGWGWNGVFNYAVALTHPEATGHATGITQAGAFAGSVFGPLAFGLIVDHLGYPSAWRFAAILVIFAALAVMRGRSLLLREIAQREG